MVVVWVKRDKSESRKQQEKKKKHKCLICETKKRKKKKTGVRNERGRVKDGGERRIWSAAEAELYSRARALRIDEEELREDIIINSRAGKTRSSITAPHIRRARAQIFILLVTDLPRSTRRERRLGGRDSGGWDDVEHSNSPHGLISHNILCKVKGNEREKSTTRPEVLFSHVHHSLSRHYSSKTQWSQCAGTGAWSHRKQVVTHIQDSNGQTSFHCW